MVEPLSRRMFVRRAAVASGSLVVGFDPRVRSWILYGQDRSRHLENLPALDGSLVEEDGSRGAFATDYGNYILRQPRAVLKPGSKQDVVRMVRYANRHGLQIGMRGQGHAESGESLVEAGIVIDSRPLQAIQIGDDRSVNVEPGALVGEVYEAAFARGLTLPATPMCTNLSVGGVLSVGGWGGSSHRFGATVDSVQELEVVTGEGSLLTCSPTQQSELFEMVLAGLGQCALILRARIGLVPAPDRVARWGLRYDDLGEFLSDQERLVREDRVDFLSGRASRKEGGGWSFEIQVGAFHTAGNEPELATLEEGLSFRSRSEKKIMAYRDHIAPATGDPTTEWLESIARRRRGDLVMWTPGAATRSLTEEALEVLSESSYGPNGFTLTALNLARFQRPLFKLPAGDVAFSMWFFPRAVPVSETATHRRMMAETRGLFDRMRSTGGKGYIAPSALPLSPADWEDHFGPDTWKRLVQAKKEFDPNRVLTPGPGIFAPPSRG